LLKIFWEILKKSYFFGSTFCFYEDEQEELESKEELEKVAFIDEKKTLEGVSPRKFGQFLTLPTAVEAYTEHQSSNGNYLMVPTVQRPSFNDH
jgi:hypothetical protein